VYVCPHSLATGRLLTLAIGSEGRLLRRHMGSTLRPLPGNAIVSLPHFSLEPVLTWPSSRSHDGYNSFVWPTTVDEYEFFESERVRFRVESEVWHDQTPRKFRRDDERVDEVVGVRKDAPYTIVVSGADERSFAANVARDRWPRLTWARLGGGAKTSKNRRANEA
jgi:hypothetical protein